MTSLAMFALTLAAVLAFFTAISAVADYLDWRDDLRDRLDDRRRQRRVHARLEDAGLL